MVSKKLQKIKQDKKLGSRKRKELRSLKGDGHVSTFPETEIPFVEGGVVGGQVHGPATKVFGVTVTPVQVDTLLQATTFEIGVRMPWSILGQPYTTAPSDPFPPYRSVLPSCPTSRPTACDSQTSSGSVVCILLVRRNDPTSTEQL